MLLAAHAAATLTMVGLIWFVQVVHYPLFALATERRFTVFAEAHQRRTGWVVMPLMLVEAGTALVLALAPPPGISRGLAVVGVALLAVIWLSTAFLQVPCHRLLSAGRDEAVIRRLVRSNWIRTVAWTARGGLVLWMWVEASTSRLIPAA